MSDPIDMTIDRSIFADPDFRRDELKYASPCPSCKYPDPARLGVGIDGKYGCSECTDYPRCYLCRRWTFGDEVLLSMDGAIRGICSVCWEKQDVEIPLDYTEDDEFKNREGQPEFNGAFNAW